MSLWNFNKNLTSNMSPGQCVFGGRRERFGGWERGWGRASLKISFFFPNSKILRRIFLLKVIYNKLQTTYQGSSPI